MWRKPAATESGGIVVGRKQHGYPAETPSRSASAWTMRTLCSLAHELGHAHYGDPPGHHGAHEIRADRFAARLLINPTEYATAEAIYGPHPAAIAAELGVTVNILKSWQQLYTALMVKSS
ncbi:ImmA/IrrE family metallo-endopeptidase [Corynebacterium sp. LaCa101]|mgnify:FL=1